LPGYAHGIQKFRFKFSLLKNIIVQCTMHLCMNGTISLFIHSFIFIVRYGIILLQDMGLTDKIVLCDMELEY
jgi:hypothetical protein